MKIPTLLALLTLIACSILVWTCHRKVSLAGAEVNAAYEFCEARLAANHLYYQRQCTRLAARAESTEETAEATLLMASEAREDAIEKLDKALKLGRHAQKALAAALAKDRTTEQCVEDAHQIVKALHAKINLEQERIVQNKKPRDSRHR